MKQQLLILGICVSCVLVLVGCVVSDSRPFQLLSAGDLVYPEVAKQAKITGSVTVQYNIQEDGTVTGVLVVRSDPPGIFDEAAANYVRTWKFLPARQNGVPLKTEKVESEITFELSELMENPPDY